MTRPSQEAIHRISVLSGYSVETTVEIFEALLIYATLQQLEGQPFTVPNIGSLSATYRGDTVDKAGKHAVVDIDAAADPVLARCIGQIHDGDITDAELRMREMNERFLRAQLAGPSP